MFTFPLRRTTGAGLLLLALTACGGAPTAAPTAEQSTGATAEPVPSPLDEYLGGATTDEEQAARQALDQQVQQKVAECMQEAGFEYTPVDASAMSVGTVSFGDSATQLHDPEWVARYGYGISTMDMQAPDVSTDPNNARVEKMADNERDAYFEALYGNGLGMVSVAGGGAAVQAVPLGADPAADPSTAEEEPVPGCLQEADVEVRGERPPFDPAQFEDLFTALTEMHGSIDTDPRLAPSVTAWSDCMADAGYPKLAEVADAQDEIFQKWADLNGWDLQGGSGGGFSVTAQAVGEAPQLDPEKLTQLKNDEIAMAQADLGCRGDYNSVRTTVQTELETAFVEAHRAELELYRDAMGV